MQALFKVVTQVTIEINDTMIKDYCKRNNPLKPMAQASEFYVPGIRDRIAKTSEGLDTFKDWSDLDLLSNKEGWEELGIAKGTFLSGMTWRSLHFHHLHCLSPKQSSMRFWADISKTRTGRAGGSKDRCAR